MNPLAANDLTVLAATSLPLAPSAREALITTTAYYQSEFHEELVELLCAVPLATDVIDAAIAAEHFSAPASALKASG